MKKLIYVLFAWLAAMQFAFAAIDINNASQAELDKLPGIGPVKAKAIVDDRQKNGPFKSIEDLKRVKGIGDKTFDNLKKEISVGDGAVPKAAAVAPSPAAKPVASPTPAAVDPKKDAKPADKKDSKADKKSAKADKDDKKKSDKKDDKGDKK